MPLEAGQIIDTKYRVVRRIGEGGMGTVYEGENSRIGRRVAIKVLHAEVAAQAELVERFEREARAAARIGSPFVCDVLDLGDLPSGDRYIVLEYLEGISLDGRLAERGKLTPVELAPIAFELLAGLGTMHEARVVHRDLKPANIFLAKTAGGRGEVVKILDFGVAKLLPFAGEVGTMTQTGRLMGTPVFMSPEQARGARDVDGRTDIYSASVIFYRALTGVLPFRAENLQELLFKIALEDPKPLRELAPEVDAVFAEIVGKGLVRDVAQRYATATEYQDAIAAWGKSQGRRSLAFKVTDSEAPPPMRRAEGSAEPESLRSSRSNPTIMSPLEAHAAACAETQAAPPSRAGDSVAQGREAAKKRDWPAAYAHFVDADAAGILTDPADLAALGEAALWTAHHPESVSARQRAYAAFLEAKNPDAAARMAAELFINFIVHGKFAVGGGWLAKARRLVEDRPDAPSRGFVAAMEALGLLAGGKLEEGAACASTAMESGAKHGDRDAHTLGQAFMACVLVRKGETEKAMPLFDEAMATATTGELGTLATGIVYCRTLCTCLDQMDYRRASEWAETIEQSSGGSKAGLPGDCRAHFAAVLSANGEWTRAQVEARCACDESMKFDFGHVALATYELGLIHLRMGNESGAEEAFRQVQELGASAEPGLSLLRLKRGETAAAAAAIEAALASSPPDPLSRARLLPAKIEIALAAGDRDGARAASVELDAVAASFRGSVALAGAAAHGAGLVAAATGAHAEAITHLRKSHRHWLDAAVPFEAARARHDLGVALEASGDHAGAALELGFAREAFERLGAPQRAIR